MTNYTEVNAILEIAAHANGKDYERLAKALGAIRGAIIDGCPVVAVHHSHEDPTKVAGFGHDYRCEREHVCRLQDYGVLRYFNLRITWTFCTLRLQTQSNCRITRLWNPRTVASRIK
jgi:hypothetical protein